jgi:hypothetical protein
MLQLLQHLINQLEAGEPKQEKHLADEDENQNLYLLV